MHIGCIRSCAARGSGLAGVGTWSVLVLVLLAWCVVGLAVALGVGAIVRSRAQQPSPDEVAHHARRPTLD